jgi:hypothetical protein
MSSDPTSLAQRKSLLISRAELERLQIALTTHELRERIAPSVEVDDSPATGRSRAVAMALIGVGVPLLGRRRLSRLLRGASMAMTAWRIARNWRAGS